LPASAFALALAAAFVHATWNMLVARARDPQAATALGGVIGALLLVPFAVLTWRVDAAALPFAAASAVIHVAYFALLARGYALGELSTVYPLARGTAPVLVLVGAAVALGESPSAVQVCGVVAVGAGVLMVRGGLGRDVDRAGEVLGLLVGVTIAAYTVVDKRGVEDAAALPYLLLLEGPSALVYLAMVSRSRGRAVFTELRWLTVVAGIGMVGAYGLVLAALQRGPAAGVAATRETSILIATLYGAVVLGERVTRFRVFGAASIVAGVAAVALG
jgi:drug/metabolite transporter (DMT)-like permease